MTDPVQRLYLRDDSSGRWHEALVSGDDEPMVHDACNVVGGREYFANLPDDVPAEKLCQRCFGTLGPVPQAGAS